MTDTSSFDLQIFKDFEHAGWEKSAADYHDLFGSGTAQASKPLLDVVGARAGMRLLDVACGPGMVSAAALSRGCSVIGLDFSSAMLAAARERYPGIDFREGDAEELPFAASSFEAVVCNFGLHHFPGAERAVAEAYRVLSPGGTYAFTSWSSRASLQALVSKAVQVHGNPNAPLPPGPSRTPFDDPEACRRILRVAGFVGETVTRINLFIRCNGEREVVNLIYKSTARTRALLEAQDASLLEMIHRAIEEGAREYRKGNVVELPMPAVMASGRKP